MNKSLNSYSTVSDKDTALASLNEPQISIVADNIYYNICPKIYMSIYITEPDTNNPVQLYQQALSPIKYTIIDNSIIETSYTHVFQTKGWHTYIIVFNENSIPVMTGISDSNRPGKITHGPYMVTKFENMTSIPDFIFYGMFNLVSINISNCIESIGHRAFEYCMAKELNFEEPCKLTSIGDDTHYAQFYGHALKYIKLPSSIKSLSRSCFTQYLSSTWIKPTLVSVNLDSIECLYGTFEQCNNLFFKNTTVNLLSLKRIRFPEVFLNCHAYTTYNRGNIPFSLNEYLIIQFGSNLEYLRDTSVTAAWQDWQPSCVGSYIIPDDNKYFKTMDNGKSIYSKDGTILHDLADSIDGSFTVQDGCTEIASGCGRFQGLYDPTLSAPYSGGYGINLGISDLILPASLTTICSKAFQYTCEMKTVTCHATTPPDVYYASSYDQHSGIIGPNELFMLSTLTAIYVPAASVDAYKASPSWSKWASIIQAIPS